MLNGGTLGRDDFCSCGTSLRAILPPSSASAWCWIRLLHLKNGSSSSKSSVRSKVRYRGSIPSESGPPESSARAISGVTPPDAAQDVEGLRVKLVAAGECPVTESR